MRELGYEEKKKRREVFEERKIEELWRISKGEGDEENEEEEKKQLVTIRENEKAKTHLMAKLCVV